MASKATKATNTAAKQRLIQEIGVLVVVAIAIIGFFGYNQYQASKNKPKPTVAQPIDTTFNTNALNQVQQKDKTDPNVTPSQSELGKSDPFAAN